MSVEEESFLYAKSVNPSTPLFLTQQTTSHPSQTPWAMIQRNIYYSVTAAVYMYNVHIHIILFYVHYLENDVFFWGAINRPLIIRRKIICNALVVFSIQTRAQLEISSEGIQDSKYIFFC